jgi:hypothetical protein
VTLEPLDSGARGHVPNPNCFVNWGCVDHGTVMAESEVTDRASVVRLTNGILTLSVRLPDVYGIRNSINPSVCWYGLSPINNIKSKFGCADRLKILYRYLPNTTSINTTFIYTYILWNNKYLKTRKRHLAKHEICINDIHGSIVWARSPIRNFIPATLCY